MSSLTIAEDVRLPDGVGQSLVRMHRAWDAGDAAAYATEFTEDASYVIFIGSASRGRAQIERDHIPLFTRWQKGSRMSMHVRQVLPLGDDAIVVVTEGGIGKGERIRHDKVQTFVFTREGDRWLCAAFQNTKRNRLLARINARETERLTAA
jgi:uncharacterized protein (TIGR02246 family)